MNNVQNRDLMRPTSDVLDFDNGFEELEIEVDFEYQPYEQSTLEYPGCSESVEIDTVRTIDRGEICLLDGVSERLAEIILDNIHEYQTYHGDY